LTAGDRGCAEKNQLIATSADMSRLVATCRVVT
jgi:hypothetical protein